jgi:nitrite reductase/ring-hydroxylating ferredoxin subunit
VDAVDGTDVDAREVFDVDAGLGDDVRHRASLYSGGQLLDDLSRTVGQRVLHQHLVEPGLMGAAQAGGVRVAAEAEDRYLGIRIGNVHRVDAADVGDHQIRPVHAVGRDEMMPREQRLELAPKEDIDPTQQDRRHGGRLSRWAVPTQALGRVERVEDGFVTVARTDDIPPGTIRSVKAGEEEIALAHCDGGFYAVQQHCLHLQGPLGDGELEGCVLTCPWHGWQYDVRTGQNEFDLAIQLRTYDVQVEDGEVRVRL